MLGAAQEAWLDEGLASDPAAWTFIAQGTVMSQLDETGRRGPSYSTDSWSGYPAARARLLETLQQAPRRQSRGAVRGPARLHRRQHQCRARAIDSPAVATEIVASSISSDPRPQAQLDGWRAENPNLQIAEGRQRGYMSLRVTPQRLHADLIAIDDVDDPASGRHTLHSCVVEAGRPVIQIA